MTPLQPPYGSPRESASGATRQDERRARANVSSFRELSPSRVLYARYYASLSLNSPSPPLSLNRLFRLPHRSTSILNRCRLPPPFCRAIYFRICRSVYCFYPRITETRDECTYPFLRKERSINETKGNATKATMTKGRRRAAATSAEGMIVWNPSSHPAAQSTARNHYPGNVAPWISLIIDMRRRRGHEQFNYGNGMLQRTSPRYPISFHGLLSAESVRSRLLTIANPREKR